MTEHNDTPTTYLPPQYGQMGPVAPQPPASEPPKRKRKPKWALPAGLVLAGLLVGGGLGGAIGYGNKPAPEIQIQEKVVDHDVIKEVTPQSCVDALDVASETITLFGDYPTFASDAIKATAASDWTGLNSVTEKIKTFNGKLDPLKVRMEESAPVCRALAK